MCLEGYIFIPIVSHWSDIRNQSSPKKNTKSNNTTTKFAGKVIDFGAGIE